MSDAFRNQGSLSALAAAVDNAISNGVSAIGAWPVQLRDTDGVVATETTVQAALAGGLALKPGTYFATVNIPAGVRVSRTIDISANGHLEIGPLLLKVQALVGNYATTARNMKQEAINAITPSTGVANQVAALLADHFAGVARNIAAGSENSALGYIGSTATKYLKSSAVESVLDIFGVVGMGVQESASVAPSIIAYRGTAIGCASDPAPEGIENVVMETGKFRIAAPTGDRLTTVHFSQLGGEAQNLVLVPKTVAIVTTDGKIEIETGDTVIDGLLQMRAGGKTSGLEGITAVLDVSSVCNRLDRPAAALAAAYRLLRVGYDKLDEVIAALKLEPLAGLPDSLVLRAEYAARMGNHSEAMSLLLQACTLDLPAFSSGLSYMTDRLRRYVALGRPSNIAELSIAGLSETAPDEAKAALAIIQPYSMRCDFALPFTLYRGPFCLGSSSAEPPYQSEGEPH